MSDNCKETVTDSRGWTFHRCSRKAVIDGYCKQHHPDAVAERRRKRDEEAEAKWQASPVMRLQRANENIERLTAECERLRAALQYCAGRMEHPRCPRCADRQQVALEALQGDSDG